MTVEARLYATFRDLIPKESRDLPIRVNVKEGTTVSEVLELLNLPKHLPRVIVVSAIIVDEEYVLKDGDTIHIFPPIAGG